MDQKASWNQMIQEEWIQRTIRHSFGKKEQDLVLVPLNTEIIMSTQKSNVLLGIHKLTLCYQKRKTSLSLRICENLANTNTNPRKARGTMSSN